MEIIVKYNMCIRVNKMIEYYEITFMDKKYIYGNINIGGNE